VSAAVAAGRLAARRVLPAAALVPVAALLALAIDDAAPVAGAIDDSGLARAAAGARVAAVFGWSGAAAVVALAFCVRWAARLRDELADGLLTADLSRSGWAAATWLGGSATLALALALGATVGALGGAVSTAEHRVIGALDTPALALLEANEARSLSIDPGALGAATRLRARLVALPGDGPVAVASLTLRRDGELRRAEGRVWNRRALEVEVPPGDGPLVVTLARLGRGAAVALERDGLTALAPIGAGTAGTGTLGGRVAERALFARTLLALTAATALALGLVPWLSTGLALGLVGALWIAAFTAQSATWPGGDLFAASRAVSSGVAPAPPSPAALATWALLVGAGLVAATLAPRTAREAGA